MKNKDQPTDRLALFTEGVVKYRIRMCGRDAVPAIIQKARVTNFQEDMPVPASTNGTVNAFNPAKLSVGFNTPT